MERVLINLISDPRAIKVGFEVVDDVTRESLLRRTVEQSKYSPSMEPLTDESESIWKTLYNWVRALTAMDSTERERTYFSLVTNTPSGPPDALVSLLACDRETAPVDACIARMERISDARDRRRREATARAPIPKVPARSDGKDYVALVMAGDHSILRQVLLRMSVTFGLRPVDPAARAQLRSDLRLTADEDGERILETLLGWVARRLVERIDQRETCWIEVGDFNRILIQARNRNGANGPRRRLRRVIPDQEVQSVARIVGAAPLYEHRLAEVGCDADTVTLARRDYLRHKAEIIALADTCAIIDAWGADPNETDSFAFYSELQERWCSFHAKHRSLVVDGSMLERGRKFYFDTLEGVRAQPLSIGEITVDQQYFLHGGLHALANGDPTPLELWWALDIVPGYGGGAGS